MPSLSHRQPTFNLRKSALGGSAASSTRTSFDSNDSSIDRFWAVKGASSEDMDLPIKKLSTRSSRQKKQSNNLGLSIKPDLHDIYQSSEEEASPNPEEVDWTSSAEDDVEDEEALETSRPHHSSEPIITLNSAFDTDPSDYPLDDEICTCHIAFAVSLPIVTWAKPRLIDIPAPTLRLKRSKATNRKSLGPHSARLTRQARKESLAPQALTDIPALDPDMDETVLTPSSTYSEHFGSEQQSSTPMTSIHPTLRSPQQQTSIQTTYTSLLPPLEASPVSAAPPPRRPSPKPTPTPTTPAPAPTPTPTPRAKAVHSISAPPQTLTLRKKESSTWKSVATSISRARKATVSGLASSPTHEDLGHYSPSIPRSKTGAEGGSSGVMPIGNVLAFSPAMPVPAVQPATAATSSSAAGGGSKKPGMKKMVPRGAAERQESVLLDFLNEG